MGTVSMNINMNNIMFLIDARKSGHIFVRLYHTPKKCARIMIIQKGFCAKKISACSHCSEGSLLNCSWLTFYSPYSFASPAFTGFADLVFVLWFLVSVFFMFV